MTATETPGVIKALTEVMKAMPAIGKGDRSPEGYQYRGVEAVTRALQPLLAEHGVVIVPKAELISVVPSPAMKDGWQDMTMQVTWTIYGPDGSSIEAMTYGIGRDRSDKGTNKAATMAYKYLLLHLLCIADTKDDADGHSYEGERRPEWQGATGEQVAEFAEVWGRLSEVRKKEYGAWRAKHRIPKLPQASFEQANRALEMVRALRPQVAPDGDSDHGDKVELDEPSEGKPEQGELVSDV